MIAKWYSGNAAEDGRATRGWLLCHFIDPAEGVRSSKDVEVKWGIHPAGDERAAWTADDQRTTLVLLVQGNFRVDLTEASVTLAKQGDYVVWGQGSITRGKRYRIRPSSLSAGRRPYERRRDSEPRSDGHLHVVQLTRHDADPGNDPEQHVEMVHQFTSQTRNLDSAGFGPYSTEACLRALDPVKVRSVHHQPTSHKTSAHTTLPSAFRYAPHSLQRFCTSISPRPDSSSGPAS